MKLLKMTSSRLVILYHQLARQELTVAHWKRSPKNGAKSHVDI
jgi:hypothetical protein